MEKQFHPIRDLLIGELILFALNHYIAPLLPGVEEFILSMFRTIITDCGRWIAVPFIICSITGIWMMLKMKKTPAYWLIVVITVLCIGFSVGVLFTKVEPVPVQEPFSTPQPYAPYDPGF